MSLYGQIIQLQQQTKADYNRNRMLPSSLKALDSSLPGVCDDLLTLSLLVPNVPWVNSHNIFYSF